MSPNFIIRPLMPSDGDFLWEMIYHAIHIPEGSPPPPHDIVYDPSIAIYVRSWGRRGDAGFVAVDTEERRRVGAAWIRLFERDDPGHAFVNEQTPELAMALLPDYRGIGIGTALLDRLIETAGTCHERLSLSLAPDNPAIRLYSRNGFTPLANNAGSTIMVKSLRTEAPTSLFPTA